MDVIYYNRISTDNKDQDPTSNLEVCKQYCKFNGHEIIAQIIDKGVSGSIPYYDRKEAIKINDYIEEYKKKNKNIEEHKKKKLGIIVFSIDRFSRQHPVRALNIIEDIKDKGVVILSATEAIFNEDTEFALPMQFMILWFNYYFLLQHSKKVKAGLEKRRKEGKFVGRGLLKKISGEGKNKKYLYYSDNELTEIHEKIKKLSKKSSYRKIMDLLKKENINLGLSYISKVMNENYKKKLLGDKMEKGK